MDPASLERLVDIVASPRPGLWPLAPGWQALLALALLGLLALAARAALRWRADAYRRAALRALRGASSAAEIGALLKRTAISAFGRSRVASLSGAAWVSFLARTGPGFEAGPATRLPELCYDPRAAAGLTSVELEALRGAARSWIRRHRRPSC